jgi:general secretion pathway protein K
MRRGLNRARQRGVAVVTALLLTTLAVTIVASLFWQQQVQVRSMENQRLHLQTKWILRGALDWARLILRQEGIEGRTVTTLDAVWAVPLAETRLDQYIERERVEGENFEATLAGQIIDAQSRYNLTNLSTGKRINDGQVKVFARLLTALKLDPALAAATAQAIARAAPAEVVVAPGPGDAPQRQGGAEPMELVQIDDLLALPGFTPQAVERLRAFALVLPKPTKLNVNTAPPEVLAAALDISAADANALATIRRQAYFKDMADFNARPYVKSPDADVGLDVKSDYFLVLSRIRLDRAALDAQALIRRDGSFGTTKTTLVSIREN